MWRKEENCLGSFFLTFTALLVVKLIKMTSITLKIWMKLWLQMGAEGYTLKIYKYGLERERVGGGEERRESGVVTWVTQEETEWQLIWVTSIFIQPLGVHGAGITAKLRLRVRNWDILWQKSSCEEDGLLKKKLQEKKSNTLLQSATRKHTADTQHTLSQDIYCIYAAEAEHTSGTFKNSQWRQHLQAVNINSFPSHLRITSLLSLIYFFIFLAHLCGNVSSFHILHVALYFKRPSVGAWVVSSGQKEYCIASVCLQLWHSTKIAKSRCAGPHVDLLQKHGEVQQMELLFMQVQNVCI